MFSGLIDILPLFHIPTWITVISDEIIAAAVLEENYFATATELAEFYTEFGLNPDSGRTLRRRIARVRNSLTSPYVDINNLGLEQRLLVCIRDATDTESDFSHVLHAQAGTFPKARVVSGLNLTLLDLEIPNSVEWSELSQVLSSLAGNASEICTFIADKDEKGTRLGSVMSHLASRAPSG